MTTFEPTAHPREKRTGEFTQKRNTDPETSLHIGVLSDAELADAIDQSFPLPQANNLAQVTAVLSAVDAGVNTGESLAEVLDTDERQGSYYANAAGYLGLVEVARDTDGPATFALTGLGTKLLAMDVRSRTQAVCELADATPEMQVLRDEGEAALHEHLHAADLSGDTVVRRAATVISWRAAIDAAGVAQDTSAFVRAHAGRYTLAAANAETARAVRVEGSRDPRPAVCGSCGNVAPLSGLCDFC